VSTPVDVALRDGSTVRVRPVRAADADRLQTLFAELSDRSRWMRFLSAGADLDRAAQAAAMPAPGGAGLVVTAGSPERILAHATYLRESTDRAEVAFEVADEWHGRGIATILLAHLAEAAAKDGIAGFVAYVHPSNHRMIGVFRDSGFPVEVSAEPDELVVEMPAGLGEAARRRFEDRSRAAAVAAVGHVLRPRSIAVIDAGGDPAAAEAVLGNLAAAGYRGDVHAGAPSLPVDLALLSGTPEAILEAAAGCGGVGVRALAVLSGGFADAGEEGRRRLARLLDICRANGMRLVGPNCLGVLNTDPSLCLNATVAPLTPAQGCVALASQSRAIGAAAMADATRRGLGVSSFVSTGDKADLSGNDFLQFWEQDDATRVILLYLESFGNPYRFGRIARRIADSKPIVAVKGGRAAAVPGETSTAIGALLRASDVSVDALFTHAGVIRTDTVAEQLGIAAVLASQPLPQGDRVAIAANARGPALACADTAAAAGLSVRSAHVIDVAPATPERYAAAIERLATEREVDAIMAIFAPGLGARVDQIAATVRTAGASGKPVIAVFTAQPEAELRALAADGAVPFFASAEDATRALARVARYARWRATPADEPPVLGGIDPDGAAAVIATALARGGGWLRAVEVHALLAAYGVPTAEASFAATPEEAARRAAELGCPVAVKAVAPELPHRSDVGGVRLQVDDAAAAERAAREAGEAVRAVGQDAEGFVVQRMAPGGVEMVVGVVGDPSFGPIVACGAAGPTLELLGDVTVRLAPLGRREAAGMVRSLRSFPLLDGYRGRPHADVPALEDALLRIAALGAAHPEIAELDCDPVLAGTEGATVIDARVRVVPRAPAPPFPALDR